MQWPEALRGTFGVIEEVPTITNTTCSTTPATLIADTASGIDHKIRRIRVTNLDTSIVIGLLIVAKGGSIAAKTIADAIKIPASSTLTINVKSNLRVGIVAASGTPSYSCTISDV